MTIPNVDPELIMSCAKAISFDFRTGRKIIAYIFKDEFRRIHSRRKAEAKMALLAGEELGIFKGDGNNVYSAEFTLDATFKLHDWDDKSKQIAFREYLQRYEPYIRFHSFVDLGENSDSAARWVSTYYDWSPMISGNLNILARWGLYAGLLDKNEKGDIVVSPSTSSRKILQSTPVVSDFIAALDSEMASSSFVLSFLGQETYDFLSADIKADLVKAMILVFSQPDNSVKLMGTALEDYVKLIASRRNVLLEQNGKPIKTIGSMIDKLRNEGILANHHVNALKGLEVYTSADLFQGLNSYRTMPVHGKDPEADMRWSLSSEVAMISVFQLLLSIRSTYYYIVEKTLTY